MEFLNLLELAVIEERQHEVELMKTDNFRKLIPRKLSKALRQSCSREGTFRKL